MKVDKKEETTLQRWANQNMQENKFEKLSSEDVKQ